VIPINDNLLLDVNKRMLLLKAFLNLTSDAVYVIDTNGLVLEANKKFEELHGWTREEIIGREIPLDREDRLGAEEVFERIVRGEEVTVLEAVKKTKSGQSFHTDVTVSPVYDENGALIALCVIERDTTAKKRAEDKLKESEERYRVLVECSPEPIAVYRDSRIVFVNPAAVRLMGAESDNLLVGRNISRFLHPDDLDEVFRFLETLSAEGGVSERVETRLIRLDGNPIYVEATAVVIEFQGGKSVQLLFRDMTDRKRAELELAVKEKELGRVIKLSPEPIVLYQSGIITFVNDMGIKLLNGESNRDFFGRSILDFFCPDSLPVILERMARVVQIDENMDFLEMKLKRLDGELVDVEVASICVNRESDDPVVQLVIRDLTERKKTEEMIRRSDRLSIAGELAAGVAHEIRNPLTALKGFMQLLKSKNTEYVDIMLVEIDRISYIVNEFLGMARPQANHFVECDLLKLMDDVVSFMNPQALLYNVEMQLTSSSPEFRVPCEPNQIKQVYMNILKNAIESMPHGGTIDIRIERKDEGTVLTRIADQGIGIPEDRLEKIGEPFFSLKEQGTGLGLMVCRRIVLAHQGHLAIRSVVGQGTTIDIELPILTGIF